MRTDNPGNLSICIRPGLILCLLRAVLCADPTSVQHRAWYLRCGNACWKPASDSARRDPTCGGAHYAALRPWGDDRPESPRSAGERATLQIHAVVAGHIYIYAGTFAKNYGSQLQAGWGIFLDRKFPPRTEACSSFEQRACFAQVKRRRLPGVCVRVACDMLRDAERFVLSISDNLAAGSAQRGSGVARRRYYGQSPPDEVVEYGQDASGSHWLWG